MSTKQVPVAADVSVDADVFVPTASGAFPLLVLRHGLTRSKEALTGWGQALAGHGFVAVIPNNRSSMDHDAQAEAGDMLTVMQWATREPSLAGKVDPQRRVVGGHSSGGLAALIAAVGDPTLRAVVLLDPEAGDIAVSAGAAVQTPTLAIFGDTSAVPGVFATGPLAGMCTESDANVVSLFQSLAGPRFGLTIKGASHCAAESPSSAGCELFCGSATPDAQDVYRTYVLAFLDAYVSCNSASFAAVDPHAQPLAPSAQIFSNDNRRSPAEVCAK
jgi:dienelactone hydrolase